MNMIVKDTQAGDAVERGIGAYLDEIVALRHDLHRHPELAFHEHRTSEIVVSRLSSWGYEVATELAEPVSSPP